MPKSDIQSTRRIERAEERKRARSAERAARKPRQERKPRADQAPDGVAPELWVNPRPLVSESLGLAVAWSPKSGCSFVSKWFFAQLEQEVEGWVHLQRRAFQSSDVSIASARAFSKNSDSFRKLRVARDPYNRAVSSYMHYLALVGKDNRSIRRDCETVWGGRNELSFRDFILGLLAVDPATVNQHWRPQTHPAERSGLFDGATIMKLEESVDGLKKFQRDQGLREIDLSALRSSHHDASKTSEFTEFIGDKAFTGDVRKQSPDYELFYDKELRDSVYELYEEDFVRFGYDR